jgi:hypothetical protein
MILIHLKKLFLTMADKTTNHTCFFDNIHRECNYILDMVAVGTMLLDHTQDSTIRLYPKFVVGEYRHMVHMQHN